MAENTPMVAHWCAYKNMLFLKYFRQTCIPARNSPYASPFVLRTEPRASSADLSPFKQCYLALPIQLLMMKSATTAMWRVNRHLI